MCGRFTLSSDRETIVNHFNLKEVPDLTAKYNIAPTQNILAILENSKAEMLRWGLIPYWAKDKKIGAKLINARSETVATKPSFKNAFRWRRCSIVADGFYEWKKENNKKQPYYFQRSDKVLFAFAGLWETWKSPEGETIKSCTILTTKANELFSPIHERMPVIIEPKNYHTWLDSKIDRPEQLESLLTPLDSNKISFYPVSSLVNNVRNDKQELILPLTTL